MATRVRKTARAVWMVLFCLSATDISTARASIRVGYVAAHEAQILTAGPPAREVHTPEPAKVESLGNGAFRITGLEPGMPTRVEFASADETDRTTLQITPSPLPPESIRIKLTGTIPPQADPADLELVAAGLQSQDAHALIAIGGLFSFEGGDQATAAAYDRAARRRLQAPSWQGVWRSEAHFGVLGALDYGPAGANRHWSNRTAALAAFEQFWCAPNRPLVATPAVYEFTLGDVACFVLDGFSQADGVEASPAERSILGAAQREWLANALALSEAPFKLVFCGRPLLVPSETAPALHRFEDATRQFLKIFDGPGTNGILLITSGGPVGELTRFIRPSGYPLNELSLGPLAGSFAPGKPYQELNYFRVPGTLVREPHFATIEITGKSDTRSLRFVTHRLDGTELWAETIEAAELRD